MSDAMRSRWLTVALILVVVGLVGGILIIRATTPNDPCPQTREIEARSPGLACPLVSYPAS